MASEHVPDSEYSDKEIIKTPEKTTSAREASLPVSTLSHRFRDSSPKPIDRTKSSSVDASIAVMVTGPTRPWEYQPCVGDNTVDTVLKRVEGSDGGEWYRIEYEDGKTEDVSVLSSSFVLQYFGTAILCKLRFRLPDSQDLGSVW
jgi:hypothetical protein